MNEPFSPYPQVVASASIIDPARVPNLQWPEQNRRGRPEPEQGSLSGPGPSTRLFIRRASNRLPFVPYFFEQFGVTGIFSDVVKIRIAIQLIDVTGTQNALIATLATLTSPGDSVLVEEMTFPGMIAAAKLLHLKLVPVAMDDQGILPASLERVSRNSGVLYCIPTNQNPTTATMSIHRREDIAAVASKKNCSLSKTMSTED